MNNMQEAIKLINAQYKQISIDYSDSKDMTALCFLGKDAETIIEALNYNLFLERELCRLQDRYSHMLVVKNAQVEKMRQDKDEILKTLARYHELEVRPIVLNMSGKEANEFVEKFNQNKRELKCVPYTE